MFPLSLFTNVHLVDEVTILWKYWAAPKYPIHKPRSCPQGPPPPWCWGLFYLLRSNWPSTVLPSLRLRQIHQVEAPCMVKLSPSFQNKTICGCTINFGSHICEVKIPSSVSYFIRRAKSKKEKSSTFENTLTWIKRKKLSHYWYPIVDAGEQKKSNG